MSTRTHVQTRRARNFKEGDNPIQNAIRRANGSGWSMKPPDSELRNDLVILHLAIDSDFWQALAATEKWSEWEHRRQDFIDYLADGGNAASFFAHVLK
jgi:hypothetical protein